MMCHLQSWHTWRCLVTAHIQTPMSSCATQFTPTTCCRRSGNSRSCHLRQHSHAPCLRSRRTVPGCSLRGQYSAVLSSGVAYVTAWHHLFFTCIRSTWLGGSANCLDMECVSVLMCQVPLWRRCPDTPQLCHQNAAAHPASSQPLVFPPCHLP